MKNHQTALLIASLLGASTLVTGCANANSATPQPATAKPVINDRTHHPHFGMHMGKPHFADKIDEKAGKHDDPRAEHQAKQQRMMAQLNLTATQQAQVQQLRSQYQARTQQYRAAMQQLDANIAAQKQAGASTAALLALYQQKQATAQQLMSLHQQERQQFLALLTPEQQLSYFENKQRPMPPKPPVARPAPQPTLQNGSPAVVVAPQR